MASSDSARHRPIVGRLSCGGEFSFWFPMFYLEVNESSDSPLLRSVTRRMAGPLRSSLRRASLAPQWVTCGGEFRFCFPTFYLEVNESSDSPLLRSVTRRMAGPLLFSIVRH